MVYCIVEKISNVCKIGYSADPQKRLGNLQTSNSSPLELRYVIDGDMKLERQLHRKFAEYRVHGEWFTFNPGIEDCFSSRMTNALALISKSAPFDLNVYKRETRRGLRYFSDYKDKYFDGSCRNCGYTSEQAMRSFYNYTRIASGQAADLKSQERQKWKESPERKEQMKAKRKLKKQMLRSFKAAGSV